MKSNGEGGVRSPADKPNLPPGMPGRPSVRKSEKASSPGEAAKDRAITEARNADRGSKLPPYKNE
jgi:hypothetical protein